MKNRNVSKTAQVNLMMLADLGIEEAVRFQEVFQFSKGIFSVFYHLPMASDIPLCVSGISEILYKRTNELIDQQNNPVVLDLACGYSPRVLKVGPEGYIYIGVDLPDVVGDLREKRQELLQGEDEQYAGYYSIDLTRRDHMNTLRERLDRPVTIITQGLLTYLTPEQKEILMQNIRSLLEKAGGCWIIPDACPDRMLSETFRAVLGSGGYSVVEGVMKIVDSKVKRDRARNGWRTTEEICDALTEAGFTAEREPLYTDTLSMNVLDRMSTQKAEDLVKAWKTMDSLVVRLQPEDSGSDDRK